jgi:hypothetical protein
MHLFFPPEGLDVARSVLVVVAALAFGLWTADQWTKRRVRRIANGLETPEDGERALAIMGLDSLASRAIRWVLVGSAAAYLVLTAVYAAT